VSGGCAVVVFAKAPVPGQAKTRLVPALGADGAAALATRLLDHALAHAVGAGLGPVELCVAPGLAHPAFDRARARWALQTATQGDGDLGARMARAFARHLDDAPHDLAHRPHAAARALGRAAAPSRVLLIGTDAPALDATTLRAAAAALADADAVVVPALDGGYALIGLSRPAPALFDGIAWSTPSVRAATRARAVAAGLRLAELPPVADIDVPADLVHLPAEWGLEAPAPAEAGPLAAATAAAVPGRSCPLHYRVAPSSLAGDPSPGLDALDVLYVVGGLYGDAAALDRVRTLFDAERGRKALVFNGDFHWFDVDPVLFARVQRGVLAHHALRGNVETELAADPAEADDAGCGCAYPDWVGDAVVQRSNRILRRLRANVAGDAAVRAALAALPMTARAEVGGLKVAIVHGDAESLAGWGFAQEHLRDAAHRQRVAGWFDAAGADLFASSHTCLPVFQRFAGAPGCVGSRWLLNNGAAGMPNFRADPAGLMTRIARTPFRRGAARRFGAVERGVHLDAIAIETDPHAARSRFEAQWPPGSDAHASYFDRIAHGPDYHPGDAFRTED
jgi:rSAM/selenodomain-associated transferase 1